MKRAQLLQKKLDATAARLVGLSLPDGAAWANSARQDAFDRLSKMGLPQARDEYWNWTRPDAFTSVQPKEAAPFVSDEVAIFDGVDSLKLTFVDGVFDADQSDALSGEGFEIALLSTALNDENHWSKDLFGAIEIVAQDPVDRPLATFNTAYADQGITLHVTGKVAKPVSISYVHTSPTSDALIHHVIKLDEAAEITVLENGVAGARANHLIEVDIADKAAFHHVRCQGRDHDRQTLTHIFGRLGAESTFKSFTMTANGVLTRNEAFLELNGDNTIAHIAGTVMGHGRDFKQDDTVFITHDAVDCESRQVYKKVLRDGAEGIFQGKILVKKDAQKTDGYQISQGLLLDGDSQFLAKPELEIYADDVICSHGSTVGAIDDNALFYLKSRGVPTAQATNLLTLAFLAEAIDEIDDEAISELVLARLESWLAEQHG